MRSLPQRAEVVIVGGGLAGAATAYELTRAGITDVVLLERESTCGCHASGRNAALCRQLTEEEAYTDLTLRGAEFLRAPPDGFSPTPLLRPTGSLLTASKADVLDRLVERAAARDLAHERIDSKVLVDRWPRMRGVDCAGGVFFPTDGVVDIHALLQGFLVGARRRGVRTEVNCEAIGFRAVGDQADLADGEGSPAQAIVQTERGDITTRCVVMAAGAWSGQLGASAGAHDHAFAAMQRHLFLTEPVIDDDPNAPFLWHLGEGEFYARPEGAGYLLSACDETEVEPADVAVLPNAITNAAAKLARAAPQFAELGVARAWACLRTFAPHRRPVITWDRRRPWMFWVAGLGGHGVTASAAVGEVAATRIAARVATRLA